MQVEQVLPYGGGFYDCSRNDLERKKMVQSSLWESMGIFAGELKID